MNIDLAHNLTRPSYIYTPAEIAAMDLSTSRPLAEMVEAVKAELGLDVGLKGKAAVGAAKKELGVDLGGTLKEQIQALCDQLGVKTGWAVPKTVAKPVSKELTTLTPDELREKAKVSARAGNQVVAVGLYTACLAKAGSKDPSLFLARALCHSRMGNHAKALVDGLR
jgi:hypothetical protein